MRFLTFIFLFFGNRIYAQNEIFLASENGKTYTSFSNALLDREDSPIEKELAINSESATSLVSSTKAIATIVDTVNPVIGISSISTKETSSKVADISKYPVSVKTISSRGTAMWNTNETAENLNNFYALHKYAPIGTLIKVKNPMNGRMVTVKIMGRLPNHEEYKNIVILVSAATARQLHVLDGKFIVQLMIPETAIYASKK